MKRISLYIILCLAGNLLISACHQSSSNKQSSHNQRWLDSLKTLNEKHPLPKMKTIASTEMGGKPVKLLAYKKPFIGYNHFYISTGDSAALRQAAISVTAKGDNNQSARVNQISEDSLYKGDLPLQVLFPEKGRYTLRIHINKNQADIPVEVNEDNNLLKTIKLKSGKQLLVALAKPQMPEKGFNDFTLGLYQKDNQLKPVNDYSFTIEPLMPSMGHGSHYNINPINIGNGLYKGRVNLMMKGEWVVKVKLLHDKELIDSSLNFNFNF